MTESHYHYDTAIDLTGQTWIGHTFVRCEVACWNSEHGSRVEKCIFRECTYVGDAWPKPFMVIEKTEEGVWRAQVV